MRNSRQAELRFKMFAAALIAIYFFLLTKDSLHAYFSPDDTMNLYRSWIYPAEQLLKANLLFFETSPFFRPMGSVWYRAIYHFAGFNAVPFHAANLLILAANIFLTYAVSRRLSGSAEVGMLTALLGCYHTAFASLYFDTGYIYDVLCYFFYFSAFLLYLRARQRGQTPGIGTLAACSLLYICALNSKEMAVTLPVFMAIYEWIYHSPVKSGPSTSRWTIRDAGRWLFNGGRAAFVTGLITVVFVIGRALGPDSLLRNEAYVPVFTWQRFMENSREFLGSLFFTTRWSTSKPVLLLWATMLAVAWATKSKAPAASRALRFAWFFVMLSVTPLAFSPPRGAPQSYIPLFGWALYAATALASGTAYLVNRLPHQRDSWAARLRAPILFCTLLVTLFSYYKSKGWSNVTTITLEAPVVHAISAELHELHTEIPRGAHIFFLDDPYPVDWENMLFVVRLSYQNDGITVDRLKRMDHKPSGRDFASYDYIFDYKGGRFIEVTDPSQPRVLPMVVMIGDAAEVYHANWSPVTTRQPARAGEVLIAKAIDLGETSPEVSPGHPFPRDPLARVLAPVEVRVNGHNADIVNQLGWPDAVNTYRVDFRIPEGTLPGIVTVLLSVRNAAGHPVQMPVR